MAASNQNKRYQVFISSTFTDLREERQAALQAVLELGHMPAGMELFPAADDSAWVLIKKVIDISDYYVLIIGGRYGSIDEGGVSFTEKEYRYAFEGKKFVIPLLHKNPNDIPRGKTDTNDALEKLGDFREIVEKKHHCAYWSSAEDLRIKLTTALVTAFDASPAIGWVRADSTAVSMKDALLHEEAIKDTVRKRDALREALGIVPEMRNALGSAVSHPIDQEYVKEIRDLHRQLEKLRPLFESTEEVRNALTRIGNIGGSAATGSLRTPELFVAFEEDVDAVKKELKRLEDSLAIT